MPRKRKSTEPEPYLKGVEKKTQALLNFLNEVSEENWQDATENFIHALGFPKEQATDRSQWFSKPDIYNSDGSSQVKAETVLNFSKLFRESLKRADRGDEGATLAPMLFIMKLMPQQLTLDTLFQQDALKRVFNQARWGILDEVAVEFAFLMPILHQQQKIGVCRLEGCGKLFLKDRRTQEYCSENHRKLDWKRKHVYPKTHSK